MNRTLNLAKNILLSNVKRLEHPFKLTFILTYKCLCRCRMCNIWKKQPGDEMTLEEVRTFFRKNNYFSWLNVSGGEIFMRKDIGELLKETVLMVEETAAQKGIETTLTLEQKLPRLDVDATGMKRVVLNLLTNAVEACSEGCRVRTWAAAEEGDGRLHIRVEDNGPGMPEEVRDRLFEPFFTTKGSRGTGLGLALVQKVVEEHRGQVQVESQPGQGTAFHIWLPVAREAQEGRRTETRTA